MTTVPPSDPPQHDAVPDDLSGRIINNNYRIHHRIGTGGMGEVYVGDHLFTGNRVAIKMVLQSLSKDPKILALFKREARTLFQLTDESIARYLDSVHDATLDRYCLIMDYIDGLSLAAYVAQQGPIPSHLVRQLGIRLARGLGRAHRLGIIHRDLSPDNVMLRGGDLAEAVLIDFGIARSEQPSEATLHGQLAGKFKYVSPEQLGLFEADIAPQSDIYGLGLVLAMAARGTPIDMGTSVAAAVDARRRVPVLDGVPDDLVPILSQMLQPDPAQRPASMSDVVALLDRPVPATDADRTVLVSMPVARPKEQPGQTTLIVGPPVLAQAPVATGGFQGLPLPPPVPTEKPARRPTPLVLIGVGGVALVILAALWFGNRPAEDSLPPPPLPPPTAEAPAEGSAQLPAPDPSTREGFLATRLEPPSCAYATRVAAGGNSGAIEIFGKDPSASTTIADAYRTAFSVAPALIERQVAETQCPALDLVRALQGRGSVPPLLTLDSDQMASGGSIIGRVSDTRGRVVWLFLVSASGAVHDLSSRLEAQADGSWLFALAAQSLSGRAEPQLLVVLATQEPLVTAAAAPAGALAADLLPSVLEDVSGQANGAAAQVAWFLLKP